MEVRGLIRPAKTPPLRGKDCYVIIHRKTYLHFHFLHAFQLGNENNGVKVMKLNSDDNKL